MGEDVTGSTPEIIVVRPLGSGADGDVYLAQSAAHPEKKFALKVLKNNSQDRIETFEREVRFLSKLKHPGLVAIEGFSLSPSPCLWMEFIDGRTLPQAAASAPPEQVLRWLRETLETLDFIHRQGVLHGDIKPANLLIDSMGRARLIDFGLAVLKDGQAVFQGSIPYIAPETLLGERGPAADLFALGTVFYESLAGRHPRAGAKSLREFFAPDFASLESLRADLPPRTARVIDRMLAADPKRRFKSARDVLDSLESDATPTPDASGSSPSFELFGRQDVWQMALDFVAERQKAVLPALVLVRGEAGTGKSRLIGDLKLEILISGSPVTVLDGAAWAMHRRAELFQLLKNPRQQGTISLLEIHDDRLPDETLSFLEGLGRETGVLSLSLTPLEATDADRFLKARLARDFSEDLRQEIFRQTQGNPGLLEHACSVLKDSGLLSKSHLTPRDLQGVLFSRDASDFFRYRWQALLPEERRILQWLAVHDGPATRDEISRLSSDPPSRSLHLLGELKRKGLIRTASNPDNGYEAAQDLLKTFVVSTISSVHKEKLHREWLAVLEKKGNALSMAHHVLETQNGIHGDPRHVEWILRASDLLSNRQEWERVVLLLERFLALNPAAAERESALRRLANAYGRLEDFRRQLDVQNRWHEEFSKTFTPFDRLKYGIASAIAHKNLGDAGECRRRLLEALEAGDPDNAEHRPRLARAHALLGLLELEDADFAKARRDFAAAEAFASPDSEQLAEILRYEATLASRSGDWPKSRTALDRCAAIERKQPSPNGLFATFLERGNIALRFGHLAEAEDAYREASALATVPGREALLARLEHNRGLEAGQKGDLGESLAHLEKARELFTFFGNPEDKALNLLQIAFVKASLAEFEEADRLAAQAITLSSHKDVVRRAAEVDYLTRTLKRGSAPDDVSCPFPEEAFEAVPAWHLKRRWLALMRLGDRAPREEVQSVLHAIHDRLSDPLKIRFEERPDYHRWVKGKDLPMDLMKKLHAITRDLLHSARVEDVLARIMDAAMSLSRAERGFLLVASETDPSGFEVKLERNLSKDLLIGDGFKMSLSAVRQAILDGKTLVTDNAVLDPRFQKSESIRKLDLKSILVLPLRASAGSLGGLYLDHTYETDIFQGADLTLLEMFADQAAIALEKARMIEGLKKSNASLSETVEEQTTEIVALRKEVEEQRLTLSHEYGEIVGQSPAMLDVLGLVDRLIDTSIPVWIFGESGTGKEMIARALHFKGPRSKKPFVTENCSSLPETLLESELFGHKKGAFTHADRDKKGLLQHADGGTVFLDEIADMSAAMQSKLLRFLQEGEIRPLGSNEVIHVDVRVVSASNRDLQVLIAEGKFREDLFYRLNGMTVTLPPLRERVEDIPLMVEHLLEKFARETKKGPYEIVPEALQLLTDYPWPGNVRELENTLRSACLFHFKDKLLPKSFQFKKVLFGAAGSIGKSSLAPIVPPASQPSSEPATKLSLILKALQETRYHKGEAAKVLGISRRYLYKQLTKYHVPLNRVEMKAFIEKEKT